MMKTYLERGSDELDGFEFLTMAEAGEVGHWGVLQELNKQARHPGVRDLVKVQLLIQKRHLKDVMAASLTAAKEDFRTLPRRAVVLGCAPRRRMRRGATSSEEQRAN